MRNQRSRRSFALERWQTQKINSRVTVLIAIGIGAVIGAVTVVAIGHMTYEWIIRFALASGVLTHSPYRPRGLADFETFEIMFTLWGNLFLYVLFGSIAGVFAAVQCIRFRRYWPHPTGRAVIALTLLNGIATLVGVGILIALVVSYTNFPALRSSTLPDWRYWNGIGIATIWGVGCLSINLVLPRLVRSIAAR